MELVWRPATEIASPSFASVWLRRVAAAIGIYLLLYSALPASVHLPKFIDSLITEYVTTAIKIVLAMILLSMLPARAVLHLRKAKPYRAFIQNLKLRTLPAFFAVVFVATGLAFGSHVAFNLEDAFGYVCDNSPKISADLNAAPAKYELGRCIAADVATCSSSGTISCSSGRPVYCGQGTPACDFVPTNECAKDKNSIKCFANAVCRTSPDAISGSASCAAQCEIHRTKLDIGKVCNATGVWLEQGQAYVVKVSPDGKWLSNEQEVTSRGILLVSCNHARRKSKHFFIGPLFGILRSHALRLRAHRGCWQRRVFPRS